MNAQEIKYKLDYIRSAVLRYFPDLAYEKSIQGSIIDNRVRGNADLAVILHLFYPDMWPLFQKKLRLLPTPFDLFISVPFEKYGIAKEVVHHSDGEVVIVPLPNRGRDILPFLKIAKALKGLGYNNILKLHTKKSPHRKDGDFWSSSMIDNLLPSKSMVTKIISLLEDEKTGIIGPRGEYLQLSVNFEANGVHLTQILNRIYPKDVQFQILQKNRHEHGFFAGSMFWVKCAALSPLIDSPFTSSAYYEREAGQIDGTFAHAMERAFSLVSEIDNRKIYEVSANRLGRIPYRTDNIPDWSDVRKIV